MRFLATSALSTFAIVSPVEQTPSLGWPALVLLAVLLSGVVWTASRRGLA